MPPLLVFTAAEAVTDLRDKLTATATAAFSEARQTGETAPEQPRQSHATPRRTTGRKLFADYLAEARAAWTPGVDITPAWVRQVTACSRGLSSRLAAALATDITESEAKS